MLKLKERLQMNPARRYRRLLIKFYIKEEQFFDTVKEFIGCSNQLLKLGWKIDIALKQFLEIYQNIYCYSHTFQNLYFYYSTLDKLSQQTHLENIIRKCEKTEYIYKKMKHCHHPVKIQSKANPLIYECEICKKIEYQIYEFPRSFRFVDAEEISLEKVQKINFFNFLNYIALEEKKKSRISEKKNKE